MLIPFLLAAPRGGIQGLVRGPAEGLLQVHAVGGGAGGPELVWRQAAKQRERVKKPAVTPAKLAKPVDPTSKLTVARGEDNKGNSYAPTVTKRSGTKNSLRKHVTSEHGTRC